MPTRFIALLTALLVILLTGCSEEVLEVPFVQPLQVKQISRPDWTQVNLRGPVIHSALVITEITSARDKDTLQA